MPTTPNSELYTRLEEIFSADRSLNGIEGALIGIAQHRVDIMRVEGDKKVADTAVEPNTYNEKERTQDVVASTGARGLRWAGTPWAYEEELSMDPSAVRLGRYNNYAPLLDMHDAWSSKSVLGRVQPGSAKIENGKLINQVRYASEKALGPEGTSTVTKVIEGTMPNLSIGYRVHKYQKTNPEDRTDGGKLPLLRAVDWEPVELSVVPIGFDDNAMTRSIESRSASTTKPKENPMKGENQDTAGGASNAAANTAPPDVAAIRSEAEKRATEAANKRVSEIIEAADGLGIPQAEARKFIDDNTPSADAIRAMIKAHSEKANSKARQINGTSSITTDEFDKTRQGLLNSLEARLSGDLNHLNENGQRFRKTTPHGIGRMMLQANGFDAQRLIQMDKYELTDLLLTTRGSHSVSDFSSLFLDAANKALNLQMAKAQELNWLKLSQRREANDFRSIYTINLGAAPDFRLIPEGADYDPGTFSDGKEQFALKTWGRSLTYSRQMILADDLGALSILVSNFQRKAILKKNDLFWQILSLNTALSDGVPLCSTATTRKNTSNAKGTDPWFLFTGEDYYCFEHADLRGDDSVQTEEVSVSKMQGIKIGAWIDFGVAPKDFRGIYRGFGTPTVALLTAGVTAIRQQIEFGGEAPLNMDPKYIACSSTHRGVIDNLSAITSDEMGNQIPGFIIALCKNPIIEERLSKITWA